ncbi:MAG TPA: MATE family efflux transporter [Gemmatimonadaceae bacterium]|nr:MATE family efflux transporter [Gemmatimonadaceae bacterium]
MSSVSKPTRADFRELIGLATPIVAVWVGIMLMGVVDSIMVGRYSAQALAAVAIGNFYFFSVFVLAGGILFALDPLVAQAVGANDRPAISIALERGLVLSVVLAVATIPLLLAGGPVLRALRQPADVIPGATLYVLVVGTSMLPLLVFTAIRQTLQAMEVVAPIVVATAVANVVNALLNWTLIFGNLGAPALGIRGAAIATAVSRVVLTAALLVFAWKRLRPYLRVWSRRSLEWGPLARMLRIGIPIGIQQELEVLAFSFMLLMVGWMGTTAVAGHQVAINLASMTFMVPLGIGAATAVVVGQRVGAGDDPAARRAAAAGLICGVGFMALSAIVFLTLPSVLASVYTNDPAVLALAVALIPIAGVFQVFDGLQVVSLGALRGIADTRTPMLIALLGYWVLGMPVGIWLAFGVGMGPQGVWWGSVVGLASVGLLLLWRVRNRFSRHLSRVVIEPAPEPVGTAGG